MIWGLLDALCVALYCAVNLAHNQLPYISDFQELQRYWGQPSDDPEDERYPTVPQLAALWLFNVSLAASCLLFFLRKKAVRYLIYAQLPFRLVFYLSLA